LEEVLPYIGLELSADTELQEIVELAAKVCGTPICLINFLDDDTQYSKVIKGISIAPVQPSSETFCRYTMQQDNILVVPDALNDERFSNNTLVTGSEKIRFYAGAPLYTSDGQRIGALCVLDRKINNLGDRQQQLLKIIAKQAMKIIELKLRVQVVEEKLKEVESKQDFINDAAIRLRSFFESSTNFHVLLGKTGEVIDYNKTAYNFVKNAHKTKLKRGDLFVSYIAPEFVSKFIDGYNLSLKGKRHIEEGSTDYGELGIIWWDATFDPARDNDDNIIGVSYLIRNVTERKQKEQKIIDQNQSLLKIAHIQAHEFRGPLSTIMGMMHLIKQENYKVPESYFLYLEQAIDALDYKIKNIVTDIEKIVG
jgi:hypothetical protein